ncbi:MAG TPA: neocarzinostatin apoprotein domain-containing protein [Mycobacteriales bacterium]|jgi:hypothetical protein|nr:neocarzinostatin apoprotein domain-containing protein [Mycobacteriales bacterium]
MHLKTRVSLGVVTVGAALGAALVPATNAFAAPTMTATWATQSAGFGLQNGDTANVSGTGFKPSSTAYLVECSGTAGQANCDLATATPTPTDASGAFSVPAFAVHTGTVGDGACNANSTCFVAASTDPTGADLTQASAAPIQFDRLQVSPRTGLKNGSAVNLSGAGYAKSGNVYVSECNSPDKPTALQHCDAGIVKVFPTDANGAFTGTYTISVPINPSDPGPFACTAGKTCILAGTDNLANPATGNIGGAIVQFAALTKTVTSAKGPSSSVAKGAKFAIKGKVTAAGNGVAGLKVSLFKVTSSGLTKLGKTKATSSTGGYKFAGLTQKKTSKYEVKSAANSSYAASHSKVVKVTT